MKLLAWIRKRFRREPPLNDDLRRVDDEPDVMPSESYMSQTRD